jgi:hypothetical protein
VWSTTSQRAAISPPGVDRLQLMFPEGDRNDAGPFAAGCAAVVCGGATVTVTVDVGAAVAVTVGAEVGVGAVVEVDGAGVSDVAWTAAEPADEEHPATATAASATSHA